MIMDNHDWIIGLVERYEKPLCRYALSLAGDSGRAKDAVQETFLRLCKADRRRIEGREAAWLFRVCRSRVIDMQRKEQPMQTLTPQQASSLAAPGHDPAESAIQDDSRQTLPHLINRLPERQREAIRLKFQQSLSYREIARVMKTTPNNVGFLIHTGVKSLRAEMQQLQGALS